jgi:hypothetical protein
VRHGGLGEPHGEAGHHDPEDGQLVQQLAQKREGRVKVGGTGKLHIYYILDIYYILHNWKVISFQIYKWCFQQEAFCILGNKKCF